MNIEHDRSVITTETAEPVVVAARPVVATEPVVVAPATREVHNVQTRRTISFPSILAGALSIVMLIIGGVMVARAGFDGPLDEPVVTVAGISGTAIGGLALLAFGLGLLLAAFSGERGAILFLSILTGIAATVVAIEPNIADGKLGFERGFMVLLAIASAVVALVAALAPTMRLSSQRVERF
jgi:hypothetical protein